MTTSTKRPDGGELNSEIVRLIDELRRDEGDSVTFISDNPDFNGQPNCAIVCNGDWTGYEDRRFAADTILDALSSAATERKLPTARQVIAESNGHHWVQRFNLVCCRDCGIVRRADDKNSPCKGIVTVELRTPTNESPAPHPPVEGLREWFNSFRGDHGKTEWDQLLSILASPSLTAGENMKSDGRVQALCRTGESEPSVTQAYRPSDPSPSDGADVVMCVCCGKPAIGKCEGPSDPSPTAPAFDVMQTIDPDYAESFERSLDLPQSAPLIGPSHNSGERLPIDKAESGADTPPTASAPDVREALEWVRGEIFALCEATEDSARDGQDFSRGRCLEAKRMRRAMGEVIRERLATLSQQPVAVADREAIASEIDNCLIRYAPSNSSGQLQTQIEYARADIKRAILNLLSAQPVADREAIAREFIAIMQRHLRIDRNDGGYIVGWSEAAAALLSALPAKGER